MRITYRTKDVRQYWHERWDSIPPDEPAENPHVYPLKYSEMTVRPDDGKILEAGCGNGRILRYYRNRDRNIIGMDYVPAPLVKLGQVDSGLPLCCGDIRATSFKSQSFRYILAFGLYHNMPLKDISSALEETFRLLEPGGRICASFRADNVHNHLIDINKRRDETRRGKERGTKAAFDSFHKINLKKSELMELFNNSGFNVETVAPVENMPLLYHFPVFRASTQKQFNESVSRRKGYMLSKTGRMLQNTLVWLFPESFCNIFVIIAGKQNGGII